MINNHAMNNIINQQKKVEEDSKKQKQVNMLKGLDAKNCDTQHINWFFNEQTILDKINKNKTIHQAGTNDIDTYLKWLSEYINKMYFIINNCALGKDNKVKCWQKIAGNENEKITFNKDTANGLLSAFKQNNFLNNRNKIIDGNGLIQDINETMKHLAQCSINICDKKINKEGIDRIMAVYEQLSECLNANPKAFVDRGVLGLGSDRGNMARNIINEHVKVKNLKDLVVGVIGLIV